MALMIDPRLTRVSFSIYPAWELDNNVDSEGDLDLSRTGSDERFCRELLSMAQITSNIRDVKLTTDWERDKVVYIGQKWSCISHNFILALRNIQVLRCGPLYRRDL